MFSGCSQLIWSRNQDVFGPSDLCSRAATSRGALSKIRKPRRPSFLCPILNNPLPGAPRQSRRLAALNRRNRWSSISVPEPKTSSGASPPSLCRSRALAPWPSRNFTESAKPKSAPSKPDIPPPSVWTKYFCLRNRPAPNQSPRVCRNTPSIFATQVFPCTSFYSSRTEPQKALRRRKKIRQIWKHSRN